MSIIPFVSDNQQLHQTLSSTLQTAAAGTEFQHLDRLCGIEQAMDYLNVEMPDLAFIDFTATTFDPFELLRRIMADPWLHHAGIVAFCDDYETEKRLNKIKGSNIIVVLRLHNLERHLPKILTIIHKNRRILFQRGIGADIVDNISGSFKLENDPLEVTCYANLICNFLFNTNKIDADVKDKLNLALTELLLNAIEHGNCGITYEEKSAWMDTGKDIGELIARRCADPQIGTRRVVFEYAIGAGSSRFLICDEGDGFDWRKVKDPLQAENLLELHGRGILMARSVSRNLTYNDKGNEVRFEFEHRIATGEITPGLFNNIEPTEIDEGDIVIREGESSSNLFYIVKGTYDVIVNDTVVSSLSADDIFLGEMSFLLNNRRSASVRARTPGRLIKLSKMEFIESIKKNPHYALFLARLLAQRIQRFNLQTSRK
jgi:anti-sigma regulatory factor (Ser/Thr protein kinase)